MVLPKNSYKMGSRETATAWGSRKSGRTVKALPYRGAPAGGEGGPRLAGVGEGALRPSENAALPIQTFVSLRSKTSLVKG